MITPVKTSTTNFSYIISASGKALIVDAGEAEPIIEYLEKNHLEPEGILLTHNHGDHCNGIPEVLKKYGDLRIYSYSDNSVIWSGSEIEVIPTPGHTGDSCCFYLKSESSVFTGDTLFIGICGRVMDGKSYDSMFDSLQKVKNLPLDTKIYPGHNYLKNSIEFMKSLELDTAFYSELINNASSDTLMTIKDEIRHNPFLTDSRDEFVLLRKLKG